MINSSPQVHPTISVKVKANQHCNLDSFPLRFGFTFEHDTSIELKIISGPKADPRHHDRFLYNASIEHPQSKQQLSGKFVIHDNGRTNSLVTAWRHDSDTEYYLSSVMKDLRKSGDLTPTILLGFHETYIKGSLRTHSDLVRELTKHRSSNEISQIERTARQSIELLSNELQYSQQLAQSEKHRADTEQQMRLYLEDENRQLKLEQQQALQQGNQVQQTSPTTLINVEEQVNHRGSSCTVLTLGSGTKWYMKTSTFDKAGQITAKAKQLIGQEVVVTSWDPIRQPGKWSSQGYFRNIYLAK
ncbi:hypothetical protein [uncultured Shewanella sp.]|uniref:hypothetical protein n=1 Tax=uncultured Shewanella sp. TaxID=173975 RepID=UPI0026149B23|nr:hypothetical protein [uncultured Shewanella sp.]